MAIPRVARHPATYSQDTSQESTPSLAATAKPTVAMRLDERSLYWTAPNLTASMHGSTTSAASGSIATEVVTSRWPCRCGALRDCRRRQSDAPLRRFVACLRSACSRRRRVRPEPPRLKRRVSRTWRNRWTLRLFDRSAIRRAKDSRDSGSVLVFLLQFRLHRAHARPRTSGSTARQVLAGAGGTGVEPWVQPT